MITYLSSRLSRIFAQDLSHMFSFSVCCQVKIQGKRVNLLEVERVISQCPKVKKVVILHHALSEIASVIVAYFMISKYCNVLEVESELGQRCLTSLPDYMQPKLVHVDDIPLQSHTGKIDRLALKALYIRGLNKRSLEEMNTLCETKAKVIFYICFNKLIHDNTFSVEQLVA